MKNLIKTARVLVSTVSAMSMTATAAFADGKATPYGPHIPVPTGVINDKLEVFTIAGIVMFAVGLVLIVANQKLKEKVA